MNQYFSIIYLCFLFASFVTGLYNWKYLPLTLKIFALFLGVTVITESLASYFNFYTNIPSRYVYHFYTPFSYVVIAIIYIRSLETPWKRKFALFSIPAYLLFNLYCTLYHQSFDTLNTYASMLSSFLVVILALFYYFDLLLQEENEELSHKPLFWISTGNLIFYAGFFFMDGFSNYFIKYAPDMGNKLMIIVYFLNFILYTLYSISFFCTRPSKKFSLL